MTYLRYQDDIIILCHSKRQLERCKRRLMTILKERHLQLSRKKTRIGSIEGGFHFLGINYLESQSPGSTNRTQEIREMAVNDPLMDDYCLLFNQTGGGNNNSIKPNQEYPEPIAIVPHARTIRKAREQVRLMVTDGFSIRRTQKLLDCVVTLVGENKSSLESSNFVNPIHPQLLRPANSGYWRRNSLD